MPAPCICQTGPKWRGEECDQRRHTGKQTNLRPAESEPLIEEHKEWHGTGQSGKVKKIKSEWPEFSHGNSQTLQLYAVNHRSNKHSISVDFASSLSQNLFIHETSDKVKIQASGIRHPRQCGAAGESSKICT
jgi:hypothetical protein